MGEQDDLFSLSGVEVESEDPFKELPKETKKPSNKQVKPDVSESEYRDTSVSNCKECIYFNPTITGWGTCACLKIETMENNRVCEASPIYTGIRNYGMLYRVDGKLTVGWSKVQHRWIKQD